MIITLSDLPSPPITRTGFPWTEATPPIKGHNEPPSAYPKITVVTPSYNQGQYLEETIRSVLLQGYPNLEYIVMDGGSKDNSVEIIQKYAPFLTYWVSEKDGGQTHAINNGFARSTGEIMGWLNSDDMLLPKALQRIGRTFARSAHVQIVTGFRRVYDEQTRFLHNFIVDEPNKYLTYYCSVMQETTYWRRSVWQELGDLDESFHFAMDYEYWLRAAKKGYWFHLIPHYLGGFRRTATQKTTTLLEVYEQDVQKLHERYGITQSGREVNAILGDSHKQKLLLWRSLGHKVYSENPRVVILLWRLAEIRPLSNFIAEFNRRYRTFRPIDRDKNPPTVSPIIAFVRALLRI
jgi:glycosyltransferase involved in cell wall biosynthesis